MLFLLDKKFFIPDIFINLFIFNHMNIFVIKGWIILVTIDVIKSLKETPIAQLAPAVKIVPVCIFKKFTNKAIISFNISIILKY